MSKDKPRREAKKPKKSKKKGAGPAAHGGGATPVFGTGHPAPAPRDK